MTSKRCDRKKSRLQYPLFEMTPLERRVLMSAGQIYIGNAGAGDPASVSEYTAGGTLLHSALMSNLTSAQSLGVTGNTLYVANSPSTVGQYTTTGTAINSALLTLDSVAGVAVTSSNFFVTDPTDNAVGEYTLSGTTVAGPLFSDSNGPHAIAVSGSNVYVADATTHSIGQYSTSGATINASLITGLTNPSAVAVSGNDLFVADAGTGVISEYTLTGVPINSSLISGLNSPQGMSIVGSTIYEVNGGDNNVGVYTTSGTTVNSNFISGLDSPQSIFAVGAGSKLSNESTPAGITAGNTFSSVTVDVQDANGNLDTLDNSNITVSIASGPSGGALSGTTTVAASNGTATFSGLTISKAGTYTLKFTDGSLSAATTGSIVVSPGTQTKLAFAQQPTGTTPGTTISPAITVNVEDSLGNTVTSDNTNVTIAIASGPTGATFNGTATLSAISGVATFSDLSFPTAGTYTLTATDGSLNAATSVSFTIGVASPNKLAYAQQPASTTTISTLAMVKVNVENASGGVLTTDTSNVTIAIATGPTGATLGGTTTVAAVAGVATFSNLTLATAGTYTLTVTDGSDTSATSTSFTITAPVSNKLAYAQQPISTTTTSTLAAVKVNIENASGGVLTTDTSNVTIAIATGPTGATLGGTTTIAAVAGVATFSNLTLTTAGTYTLTVTDGSLTSATSTSFTISVPGSNKLAFGTQPSSTTTTTPLNNVTVDVENSSGVVLTSDTSSVTLAIATGPTGATLGGTATVAAVNGVATFTGLTLTTAGTYTLIATDGSDTSTTSVSFTISAPGTNKLIFATQPIGTTTGATLAAVRVEVENSAGVLLNGDTSNVTLAIATGPTGATIGGTLTVAAVAGVATFSSLSFPVAGDYTLTATDGADTSATSISFTIAAPSSSKLVFGAEPQSTSTSAALLPVKVYIENSAGTLLTTDSSSVTIAIATGPAGSTLGGTLTVAAVGGIATFSNLVLSTAGTYTLTATDTTDTAVISTSFIISPPTANKLVFSTQPINATPTTSLGTVVIDVENSAGVLIGSDNSAVTLAIATGTAGATLGGTVTVNAVNGVATFTDLLIATPGTTYMLSATDGTDVPATSAAFNITAPVVPDSLVFTTQPVNTTIAGTLGTITVNLEDSTGALATTNAGSLTLSITGAPAGVTLGGVTTVTAVNGVATFTNLTINTPGAYTLTAAENGQTSGTSTAFTVYYPPVIVGQLDPTFGSAGVATSNVGFTSIAGSAVYGTGTIAIGTTGAVPTESFAIVRYNANGSLDSTFGAAGIAGVHFTNTDDVPAAVIVLPGGQILIAGTATTYVGGLPTTSEFAIAELNANGTLDTSFGNGTGEIEFGFSTAATHDVLTSMAVAGNGTIYLGGRSDSRSTTGNDFAIISLNSAGAFNSAFGAGGQMLVDFDNGSDTINALAVQKNGDLVAVGSATVAGVVEIGLARLLPSGILDKHFGTAGLTTTDVRGVYDAATSVTIQPKGQIVIGGASATPAGTSSDFVVARYAANGKLDQSFGGGPVVTTFNEPSAVTQVIIQANGDIIATGKTTPFFNTIVSNELALALARYTTRGVLDKTFNGTGLNSVVLATPTPVVTGNPEVANAMAELIASGQGASVLTSGSNLLIVGNDNTSTVEAQTLTTGVDLITTVTSTLPAAIAGGTKATATVLLTERGADAAQGTVTLVLELATDAQGNGAIPLKTVAQKINLPGGRGHAYKIAFVYPTNVTGHYYLLANVISASTPAMRDLNLLNNLSHGSSTVSITPPFTSLVGSALSAVSAFDTGKLTRVQFTIANAGNVVAKGKITVNLYLSSDKTVADGSLVPTGAFAIGLQPGTSHQYKLTFKLAKTTPQGTFYLIAVIDPLNSLGTTDHSSSSTVLDNSRVSMG